MLNFNIKTTLLSLILITSCSSFSSIQNTISTYENNDWTYLEFLFVIQPKNALTKLSNHAQVATSTIGAGFLAHSYFNTNNTPKIEDSKDKNWTKTALTFLSAFAVGSSLYNYFICYTTRNIQHKTFKSFLLNWNLHKEHLPTNFIAFFNELHAQYVEKGDAFLTDELVAEVFHIIHHHLEHQFKDRYKYESPKAETTISTIKTMTDIMKNIG